MKYSYRPERDAVDESMRDFQPTHRSFRFKHFVRTALITTIYASGAAVLFGTLAYCANSAAHAEYENQREMDALEYSEWKRLNPPNLLDLSAEWERACAEVRASGICGTDSECQCLCYDKEDCDGGPEN